MHLVLPENVLQLCLMEQKKKLENLKKGDLVMTKYGNAGKIICVLRTICSGGKIPLVKFPSGLLVTPWHPIQVQGVWRFPADLGIPEDTVCHAVYSFVLESDHVMVINDTCCVTLAHGFSGPVVGHSFFGSPKVLDSLKNMSGWEEGHVTLMSGCLKRDITNGLVNGLIQTP